jgi:hypothetical protein
MVIPQAAGGCTGSPTLQAPTVVLGPPVAIRAPLVVVALVVGARILLVNRDRLPDIDTAGAAVVAVMGVAAGVAVVSVVARHLVSLLL